MSDQERPNTNGEDRDEQHDPSVDDALRGEEMPVDEEPLEEEATPRRAASAEFEIDAEIGSAAALREAMDPANQSLAEALRLSFRVLQLVIVVLLVLFFASGFKTVDEGQSGVLTRFGKIVPVAGQHALDPGLQFSRWPYPVGEFVVFDVENRSVTVRDTFWPYIRPGQSFEDATAQARTENPLNPVQPGQPRGDGYLLTSQGDIAHVQIDVQYRIDDPVRFVERLPDRRADRVVRLAVERAVVHVGARRSLSGVVDRVDDLRHDIQLKTQEILNQMDSGITVHRVELPQTSAPLAVRRTFAEAQEARVQAENRVERARQQAERLLIDAAGERYRHIVRLINTYEDTLQSGDEQKAEELLARIHEMMEGGELSGEVARTIQLARAYRSRIEATLGNEARRFNSLLPAFRDHPELVVQERWLQAYARVFQNEDTEIYYMPRELGTLELALSGLHEVREKRQQIRLDRREREAEEQFRFGQREYIFRARDIRTSGPGRQFEVDEDGRMVPLGRRR